MIEIRQKGTTIVPIKVELFRRFSVFVSDVVRRTVSMVHYVE